MGGRRIFRIEAENDRVREVQIARELESHMAMCIEALMSEGKSREEATRIAESRFGGDVRAARKRLMRSARRRDLFLHGRMHIGGVGRDARLALRAMLHKPVSALLSVLTFAVAIGFMTSIYTVVNQVLLRPLPFPESDRIVQIASLDSAGRDMGGSVSARNWMDWRDYSRTLSSTGLYSSAYDTRRTIGTGASAARVEGYSVRGAFFETLRARFLVGRAIGEAETLNDRNAIVVSERVWREHLGSTRDLSSAKLVVDGRQRHVVGVLAAGQAFPREADIWLPGYREPTTDDTREWLNWQAIGRLAPNTTLARAQEDMERVTAQIHANAPRAFNAYGARVTTLQSAITQDASTHLWMLLCAITLVCAIGCANLSAINFARALSRREMVAVRLALGAGRARVFAQLVTEQVVLSLVGGAIGLGFAALMTSFIASHSQGILPRASDVGMDANIFLFGLLASFAAGLLAGAAPAWRVARTSPASLVSSSRGTVSTGMGSLGRVVIVAEVALSATLLCSSALLIHSFRNLTSQTLGFDPHNVMAAGVVLDSKRYDDPVATQAFWTRLLERVRALPDVERVGLTGMPPGHSAPTGFIRVPGVADQHAYAGYRIVEPNYFEAAGIRLVAGRYLDDRDRDGGERVTVISETMARNYWPGQNPLGKTVYATSTEGNAPGGAPPLRVVGVVNDVRHFGYESDMMPEMYVSWLQMPSRAMTLIARGRDDTNALGVALQREILALDPTLTPEVEAMSAPFFDLLKTRALLMDILTAFGVAAAAIAAIGIFSLLAITVTQRTREMGVRTALGATMPDILMNVLRPVVLLVSVGIAIGLAGAYLTSTLLENSLFEVSPLDVVSMGGTALLLFVTALVAASVPALRAARTDPLTALRDGG